jgi:hypothetical protein
LAVDAWQLRCVADEIRAGHDAQPKKWIDVIKDVESDVIAKTNYMYLVNIRTDIYRGPPEFSIPIPDILTTVTTRDKDGKEVSNCEVWYCLKALINYKDRYYHFDQLSSPTVDSLAPGNYVFWTQKGRLKDR